MLGQPLVIFSVFALILCANPSWAKDPADHPGGRYSLDPSHTSIVWRVNHLGFSFYTARFDRASGELNYAPDDPISSSVVVTVDTASVSTGLPGFDKDLRSAAWFDAEAFPKARFVSTAIARTGPTSGQITGMLTLKGITKPIILDATFNGGGTFLLTGKRILGFSATATLSRSDFGIKAYPQMVGDTVQLLIQAEFTR